MSREGDGASDPTHAAVAAFLLTRTRQELDTLAADKDIPLHTLGH